MIRSLLIVIAAITVFSIAVAMESNIIGFVSLLLFLASILSYSWWGWNLFLTMAPLEIDAYDANSLATLDIPALNDKYYYSDWCFVSDIC